MTSKRKAPTSAWKPGQSGNPRGRKPGTGEVAELRAAISQGVPQVLEAMLKKALAPHVRAATNALLMQDLVTAEVTEGHRQITDTVLATAEVNKQVILGHRTDIKNLRDLNDVERAP